MDKKEELKNTLIKLAAATEDRKTLIQYRDRQICELLAGGMTWVAMQQLSGLSVRGVALAVKRGKGSRP